MEAANRSSAAWRASCHLSRYVAVGQYPKCVCLGLQERWGWRLTCHQARLAGQESGRQPDPGSEQCHRTERRTHCRAIDPMKPVHALFFVSRGRQTGMTLVELMASMAIGLLIAMAATALLVSTKSAY